MLDLAATALSSLKLAGVTDDDAAGGPPGADATPTASDRSNLLFDTHASEYFKTLDVRVGGDVDGHSFVASHARSGALRSRVSSLVKCACRTSSSRCATRYTSSADCG